MNKKNMENTTLVYIEHEGAYLMLLRNKQKVDINKGKWIGVIGDVLDFSDDGTYQYIQNAVEYNGAYRVDFDKLSLDITINGKTNPHDQDQWGLSGRVLHIGKQYYFKLTE